MSVLAEWLWLRTLCNNLALTLIRFSVAVVQSLGLVLSFLDFDGVGERLFSLGLFDNKVRHDAGEENDQRCRITNGQGRHRCPQSVTSDVGMSCGSNARLHAEWFKKLLDSVKHGVLWCRLHDRDSVRLNVRLGVYAPFPVEESSDIGEIHSW